MLQLPKSMHLVIWTILKLWERHPIQVNVDEAEDCTYLKQWWK